jgi:hypothetical protein
MAGGAGGGVDGFAVLQHLRRVGVLEREAFVGHGTRRLRLVPAFWLFGAGAGQLGGGDELHQQDDADDDDEKEADYCNDQLLRRLDG